MRLKEQKIVSEIVAVSIGPKACQETLRTALAMGVDKGIHVPTDLRHDQDLQPLAVAKIFKYIAMVSTSHNSVAQKSFSTRFFLQRDKVDMVILGKQAIDGEIYFYIILL